MSLFLPNWGFRNTIHAYHSDEAVQLPLKSLTGNDQSSGSISLSRFVETRIPGLKDNSKYNLKYYLFNGALQTLYTFQAASSFKTKVYSAREIIKIPDNKLMKEEYPKLYPGQFSIDYVVDPPAEELDNEVFTKRCKETLPEGYPRLHPRSRYYTDDELNELKTKWSTDDKPIIIIVSGLGGGIQEAPLRAVCGILHKSGFHTLILNPRGSARSKITTPYVYSGLEISDLRYLVDLLHDKFNANGKRQLHAIGFSFGGLQIANYLAKFGKDSKLTSAVSFSSPWDLNQCNEHINSSLSGRYLFQPSVIYTLLKLLQSNKAVLAEDPNLFTEEKLQRLKKTAKMTVDVDNEVTCHMSGLPTGKLYYYAASPFQRIFQIRTPMLIINSLDDPIISPDYPFSEVKKHPWLYMATSDLGGHYSFIKNNNDFWFTEIIEKWITSWTEVDATNPHDINDNGWDIPPIDKPYYL